MKSIKEGKVQVVKDNRFVRTMEDGALFGELAILHHCERTATVRGKSEKKRVFQGICRSLQL